MIFVFAPKQRKHTSYIQKKHSLASSSIQVSHRASDGQRQRRPSKLDMPTRRLPQAAQDPHGMGFARSCLHGQGRSLLQQTRVQTEGRIRLPHRPQPPHREQARRRLKTLHMPRTRMPQPRLPPPQLPRPAHAASSRRTPAGPPLRRV